MYCKEVSSGLCDGTATPRVVKETSATALVDGRNGIGPVSNHSVCVYMQCVCGSTNGIDLHTAVIVGSW